MSRDSMTFIDLCLAGDASPTDVDDFIDRWHDGAGSASLREYLGMSETEYSLWVNDPDVLPYVINSRRDERPFAEVVNDSYYPSARRAATSDQSEKLRLLRDWLKTHGTETSAHSSR